MQTRRAMIRRSLALTAIAMAAGGCPPSTEVVGGEPPHWRAVPSPTNTNLTGVWTSGVGDVWAVGDAGTVLHWDGASFSATTVGTADFRCVGGSGPNDVWIAGRVGSPAIGVFYHYDGVRWSHVGVSAYGVFTDLWVSSATDAWAVLASSNPRLEIGAFPVAGGVLWHWDGSHWTSVSPTVRAGRVRGHGADNVWATAEASGTGFTHWDGHAWTTPIWIPDDRRLGYVAANPLERGLWVSGDDELWLTGGWPCRYDGTRWNFFLPPRSDAGPLGPGQADIWGAASDDVWFVGVRGAIGHWDGSHLAGVVSPVHEWLWSIHGSGALDIWAVGNAGTIAHYGP